MKQVLPTLMLTSFAAIAVLAVACNPSKSGTRDNVSTTMSPLQIAQAKTQADAKALAAAKAATDAQAKDTKEKHDKAVADANTCFQAICAPADMKSFTDLLTPTTATTASVSDTFYTNQIKPALKTMLDASNKDVQALKAKVAKLQAALPTTTLTADQDRYLKAKLVLMNRTLVLAKGYVDLNQVELKKKNKPLSDLLIAKDMQLKYGVESYLRQAYPDKSLADAAATEAQYIKDRIAAINTRVFPNAALATSTTRTLMNLNIDAAIAKQTLTTNQIADLSTHAISVRILDAMMGDDFSFMSAKPLQSTDLVQIAAALDISGQLDAQISALTKMTPNDCDAQYSQYISLFPADATALNAATDSLKKSAVSLLDANDDAIALVNAYAFKTDGLLAQNQRDLMLKLLTQKAADATTDAGLVAGTQDGDINLIIRLLAETSGEARSKPQQSGSCPMPTVSLDDLNLPTESEARISPAVAVNQNATWVLAAHELAQLMLEKSGKFADVNSCVKDKLQVLGDNSPEAADVVGVRILQKWVTDNKPVTGSLNFGCYLQAVGNSTTLASAAGLNSPLFRALQTKQIFAAGIPDSCQKIADANQVHLPGVCN